MASVKHIDYETVNRLMKPHNRAYKWPTRTCLHPAIDLLEYIRGKNVPLDPILDLSETEAGWLIVRLYGGSWFKFVEHYLIKHDYGHTIPVSEIESGDIVEFSSDRIKAVGPVGHLIKNPVAIVGDKDTLFLRGFGGISQLPTRFVKIVNAARFHRPSEIGFKRVK